MLKYIPVRGRKLKVKSLATLGVVKIYPREGTETIHVRRRQNLSVRVEIYPREGTETMLMIESIKRSIVEIYPREGTETSCKPSHQNACLVEIYPREGIETRDVKTIKSSFFPNLNDKFNPNGLYKKGKMC